MPPKKPKKHPKDMTTDEAMEHLFGKRGTKHARKMLPSEPKPQVKPSKPSTKDKSR